MYLFLQHLRWSRYNVLLDPFCGENAFGASRPGFIFSQVSFGWLASQSSHHFIVKDSRIKCQSRWWFSSSFYVHSYLGKMSNLYIWYFSNGLVQPPTSFTLGAKVNFVRPQSFGCMWRSWWQFCYISLLGDVMEMLQSSVKSLKRRWWNDKCIDTVFSSLIQLNWQVFQP